MANETQMSQTLEPYEAGGYRFMLRPNTSDHKGVDEVMKGGYRRTRPFAFDVEAGEQWIDLGAMVGGFTVYAGMRGGVVRAVEADPLHVKILVANASKFPGVNIVHAAVVADDRKIVTLHRNDAKGNTWRNSIIRPWRGGTQVDVPTVHISDLINLAGENVCIKMDIEGEEMPVLEWLLDHPVALAKVKKLTFEWSFDVDPNLKRFRLVMARLMLNFPNVAPGKMYSEQDVWPKTWFPPCTTIFCMR